MSKWGKLAGAISGGVKDAREIQEERQQRELQQAALLAHLDQQGYGVGSTPDDPGRDVLSSAGVDEAVSAATGGLGFPGIGMGHQDAKDTRYETVTKGPRGLYRDKTRTPEAREERKRAATAATYRGTGMSEADATAAAMNPSLADNFLPKSPSTQERTGKRVRELMASHEYQLQYKNPRDRAMAAAQQARAEMGEAPSFNPTEVHATNRRFDVQNPLPSRSASSTGESPERRNARQNATAIRGQIAATSRDLGAAERSIPKRPDVFMSPGDSTRYETAREKAERGVQMYRARKDSLTGVLDRVTGSMQDQPTDTAQPRTLRPLTDSEQTRAARDPKFAAFLRSKGYTVGGQE